MKRPQKHVYKTPYRAMVYLMGKPSRWVHSIYTAEYQDNGYNAKDARQYAALEVLQIAGYTWIESADEYIFWIDDWNKVLNKSK